MSNRKTWAWTDDPSILRNRITILNQELDAAEATQDRMTNVIEQTLRDNMALRRRQAQILRKITALQTWTTELINKEA